MKNLILSFFLIMIFSVSAFAAPEFKCSIKTKRLGDLTPIEIDISNFEFNPINLLILYGPEDEVVKAYAFDGDAPPEAAQFRAANPGYIKREVNGLISFNQIPNRGLSFVYDYPTVGSSANSVDPKVAMYLPLGSEQSTVVTLELEKSVRLECRSANNP